jgi:hypothetical protein
MQLSDDDLYRAAVDPAYGRTVTEEFNTRTTQSPLDYQTFITRATEVGLQNVASRLSELQSAGTLTADAVRAIRAVSPDFARQMMDVLYGQGAVFDTELSSPLSLVELLQSFEFAAIGSAARNAGLELPTRERLQEIRAAGVERARAIEGYQTFGRNAAQFNAAVQRARGRTFTQTDFESASFLGDASAATAFEAGLASEEAAGQRAGAFRFGENPTGRITQRGFGVDYR